MHVYRVVYRIVEIDINSIKFIYFYVKYIQRVRGLQKVYKIKSHKHIFKF